MTDTNLPQTPAGTGDTPGPAGQAPQGDQGYVSKSDLTQLFDEFFSKRVQPFVDKTNSNLSARVKSQLENLNKTIEMQRAAGINISDEQAQALQQKIIQADQQGTEAPAPGKPSQLPQENAEGSQQIQDNDPVAQTALKLQEEAGVELFDDDPEVQDIKYDNATTFLRSVADAITAKKARLQLEGEKKATVQAPGIGTGGGSPGNYQGRNAMDLLTEHYKKNR